MINRYALSGLALAGLVQPAYAYDLKTRLDLEPLIVKHAAANNIPAALVHRVIIRESRYNPRAVGRGGALGLMQIKHGTARALGYTGGPAGLLDADTNLTYAVRYLAGAYRVAGGDQNRAVGFYARGYYYDAKRKGMLGSLAKGRTVAEEPAVVVAAAPQPEPAPSIFSALFSPQRPAEPVPQAAPAVAEEPEGPASTERSSRSAKRKGQVAVVPPARPAVIPREAAHDQVQPVAAESPSLAKNQPRSTRRRAPTDHLSAPEASGEPAPASQTVVAQRGAGQPDVSGPLKPGGRSAKRSAASGAGRSVQRVSAQPGGLETNP